MRAAPVPTPRGAGTGAASSVRAVLRGTFRGRPGEPEPSGGDPGASVPRAPRGSRQRRMEITSSPGRTASAGRPCTAANLGVLVTRTGVTVG